MSEASNIYRQFLEALNSRDLDAAARCVDVQRYQENCVGFTDGYVRWEEAKASLTEVWKGLPDLRVELVHVSGDERHAIAHGIVRGTALGKLYGAPASRKTYEASFFDYVEVDDKLIVDRVQQADVLGQMRQLYGKTVGLFGIAAMFLKQPTVLPRRSTASR
jgi:predicted ester cyclase